MKTVVYSIIHVESLPSTCHYSVSEQRRSSPACGLTWGHTHTVHKSTTFLWVSVTRWIKLSETVWHSHRLKHSKKSKKAGPVTSHNHILLLQVVFHNKSSRSHVFFFFFAFNALDHFFYTVVCVWIQKCNSCNQSSMKSKQLTLMSRRKHEKRFRKPEGSSENEPA